MSFFKTKYALLVSLLILGIVVGAIHRTSRSEARPAKAAEEQAVVIDGDTIQFQGRSVQIHGIDAPELGQRCFHDGVWTHCGLQAAYELKKLLVLEQGPLECRPAQQVSSLRMAEGSLPVMRCFSGDVELAVVLLESGYVVALPNAEDRFHELEATARRAKLGLWHTDFTPPDTWRQGERLPHETANETENCPVKGIVSVDGERRYYVPTDQEYESVKVVPSRGDQLFCSDEDARRDGWRR